MPEGKRTENQQFLVGPSTFRGAYATQLLPVRSASAGIGHDQQRAARLRQPILEKWKRRGVTVGRVGEHVAVALADETLLRCVGGAYFQEGARLK